MTDDRTNRGTDATFWKGLALWLAGFAVLALAVGGVVAVGLLGVGSAPPAMDDLHVSNADDANHTVTIEIHPANDSSATFERTVHLSSGERVSFDGTTERGRQYRLLVTVDDRASESFEIEGPDDRCTIEIDVESTASASVGESCA